LEASYQHGLVRDADTLAKFIGCSIAQCRCGGLKFAREAREGGFFEADRRCDLFLNNHVANRASRAQGQAMLASSASVFALPVLVTLAKQVRRERLPGHAATVFGMVARQLDLDWTATVSVMLFQVAKNAVSAAVRLGIVGPIEGQKLLAQTVESRETEPSPAMQISPVLDLLQGTQDRLYSRLFQS
jgi:urease accessory protein